MRLLLASFLFLLVIPSFGQRYRIEGYVFDAQTTEPLMGAEIHLHETSQGTYSNEQGYFLISSVKPGHYHLHVHIFGYHSGAKTIKVDSSLKEQVFYLEPTVFEMDQITIEDESQKLEREKNPLTIELADKDFLKKNYGNTLLNTLEEMPGLQTLNTGTGISKPVIRGLSFNRVAVNDNGLKQEGQQWGLDHGLEIDQFNVEQVELIKGPASFLYGSDAMAGVINIKPPDPGEPYSISGNLISLYRSNNDNLGTSIGFKGRSLKYFFNTRLSYQSYGDFKVPADSFSYLTYTLPIYGNQLKNTAGEERDLSVSAGSIGEWGKFRVKYSSFNQKAGFFSGAIGIPRAFELEPDGNHRDIDLPYQKIHHHKIQTSGEFYLLKNWLEVTAGYQKNLREEHSPPHVHDPYAPETTGSLAHRWTLHTISMNSRYNYALSDSASIVPGISFQIQNNDRAGFEFLLPSYGSQNYAGFIYSNHQLSSKTVVSGGLRLDYFLQDIERYIEPVYGQNGGISYYDTLNSDIKRTYFSWSGAAGLSFKASSELLLKMNVGKSFRIPTVPELAMNGVHHGTFRHEKGNPALKPENGYQLDLSLHWDRKIYHIRASPFFNYFTNFIYLKPTVKFSPLPDAGQIYEYTQDKALHTGFEISGDYHPAEKLHIGVTGEYVYTMNLETGLGLPFIPPFTTFFEMEYTSDKIGKKFLDPYVGVNLRAIAAQNRTDRNERTTPGYFLLNFTSGVEFKTGNTGIAVSFRINNILNQRYLKHLSRYRILNLYEPGRNIMVTLEINYR